MDLLIVIKSFSFLMSFESDIFFSRSLPVELFSFESSLVK